MIGALVLGALVGTFVCFAVLAVLAWVTDNRDYSTCHPGAPVTRDDTEPTRPLILPGPTLADGHARLLDALATLDAEDDLADARILAVVERWRAEQ